MSNFYCEQCGKAILDSPDGYYTECPHYPLEEKTVLSPNGKGRITHKKIEKIIKYYEDQK